MKKTGSGIFLTLLLMYFVLLPGSLMAQLLATYPSAQISSLNYPSINYLSISSPSINYLSINSPSISYPLISSQSINLNIWSSSSWDSGQLRLPSGSSYLSPSQLNLSWNIIPYPETTWNTSYLETNRSNVLFTPTSLTNSLWYWPTTAPDWSLSLVGLGNQVLNFNTLNSGNSGNVGITTPKPVAVDFNQLWQKVSDATGKGLPKTAIEYLKEMIPLAIESEKYGVVMKAICKQLVLEANIQGNKPEEKIIRLTEEIEKAPELLKPLLNLVLAQWYWQYYQNNRYRFSERDATATIIDTDFTTWDLPRLLDKIDDLYTQVLSQEEQLKSISMDMFTDFFTLGDVPTSYRPTLYDFAAFSAISFYQDGDQIRKSPEDAFELDADSDAFAQAEAFITYSPETTDTSSPLLKALKLYQKLLNFHLNDPSKGAFFDADINRLVFVNAHSFGEEKSSRYMTRLSEIAEGCTIPDLSSLACYYWAQELYNQPDYAEAHKVAQKGAALDAGSYGGKMCRSLLTSIEAREMTLESEYSMTPTLGEVKLDYRNITKVHFRIITDQWDYFTKIRYGYPGSINDERFQALLQKTAIKSWSVALEPTTDFLTHSQKIDLPSLRPGYYSLIASWREDFANKENAIYITSFWVTEIAMLTKTINGQLECFVLDAKQGAPLKGAKVTVFYQDQQGYYQQGAITYTDENGSVTISDDYQRNAFLYAQYNNYALLSQGIYVSSPRKEQDELQRTIFFTDRSLYRPGQTIHFKVLAIKSDQSRDSYNFLPNTKLTVTFKDVNYQEVEHLDLVTNAFGSASGIFTAPSGTLTGNMTISCSQPSGSTSIRVEEYKRPKFKVTLDPPQKEGRLDEEIELPGQVMAYSGAPVDEADISYRVTREVRYPYWCWWSRYKPSISREIAHGRIKTDAEGKFNIRFTARPDRSILQSDQPTFTFKVSVDAIDSAGETRSTSKSIQAGYVSMSLDISAGDWLTSKDPVKCSISAMTLDQQPLKTIGTVTVYTLKQPQEPIRSSILGPIAGSDDTIDESNWETWPEDKVVATSEFDTSEGASQVSFTLEPGAYRVIATAYDRYGEKVEAMLPIMVLDPTDSTFTVPIPNLVKVRSATLEVGDTLEALWGTGYEEGHALVEIEHRGKIVKRYWTDSQNTQQKVEWAVGEEHRGGFFLHITQVHDNRVYISNESISVPWSNKKLEVSFSSFRSKLDPGAEETWTIQIKGPNAENVAAELAATLYDASLDAFLPNNWPGLEGIFRQDYSSLSTSFANQVSYPANRTYNWNYSYSDYSSRTYTQFPEDVSNNYGGYYYGSDYGYGASSIYGGGGLYGGMGLYGGGGIYGGGALYGGIAYSVAPSDPSSSVTRGASAYSMTEMADSIYGGDELSTPAEDIDLSQVSTRTNFNETAFFFPQLLTDDQGQVSITFTMPETLTTWKFMSFAHAKNLLWGMFSEEIVTQKNLMVQANPPRFLREGDTLLFSAKVTNLSDQEQSGIIRLSLSDTLSEQSLDKEFLNGLTDQSFSVPAKSSRSFFWEITVPDYSGAALTYKVVASTGELSDGEEDALPVLSRRIFVTESLPLPIRGPETKTFSFDKLLESGQSQTLEHQALTLQMTSNPAWYAVQSLPYLMESPYECSERVFSQLYANAIARHIANSDPEIKHIFSQWEGTDALDSNLEKNEDLKSVLLEETPWVRAAERESESKKRIGLLFDDENVANSLSKAYDKLAQMQLADGSWPWFPGGWSNFYITLYIMTGFGRLRHMDIDIKQDMAIKCLNYVDNKIYDAYEEIGRQDRLAQNNLSSTIALYLYGRSFYLDTHPIPGEYQAAVNYFLAQASQYWLDLSRLSQGHLALACQRFNDQITAQEIMASLKERSVSDEEMGMFWRDLELSWWWYKAPIETQVVMIEAFDEVSHDQTAVEDLKIWLLKQKQTQNWKTSKSTADAVYALLLRGENLLASDELVKVTLGNLEIVPENVEAGTGFYEKKFIKEEVKADYGKITVEKLDQGVAWGSLHWQYLEDMSKVTSYETPLQLEKTLYVQRQSKEGPVIEPVTGDLAVGDLITIRIILRVDRDMEYVHMEDYRGSGTEPVNVFSQYKYQDGLAYYESTRDTATHFFIDYLPKGTYVFEYPVRIQHRGEYQMGIATIQCLYAPEFNSHSASQFITVL